MGTITALTPQKRKQNRVNVYLDGEFAFGIATAVTTSLHIGQTLTSTQIAQLKKQDEAEKAREAALRLINQRPRSTAEIEQRLKQKGHAQAAITAAITRLQAATLLDDETFAHYWVEQRERFKPRSQLALSQELRQKGIDRTIIEKVVVAVDETAAAQRAATKKLYSWANLPEEAFRTKLAGFLQRRGFSYEIVRQVTDELWQEIAITKEDD